MKVCTYHVHTHTKTPSVFVPTVYVWTMTRDENIFFRFIENLILDW